MIDTAAGDHYPDAQDVSAYAGAALLVVRRDVARLAGARKLAERIGAAGANVVGTLFNRH